MKAPGREKIATFFPLKRSSDVTSFQSKGFASSDSMRLRVLKVTLGIESPSLMGVECSGRLALEREDMTLVDTRAVRAGAKAAAEVRKDATVKRASFILEQLMLEIVDTVPGTAYLRSSMDFVSVWSSLNVIC